MFISFAFPFPAIRLSDLQNILSGLQIPAEAGASGAAAAAGGGASEPHVDLSAGITADAMKPLLSNKDFVKGMKELLPTEAQTDNLDEVANEINGKIFLFDLVFFYWAH